MNEWYLFIVFLYESQTVLGNDLYMPEKMQLCNQAMLTFCRFPISVSHLKLRFPHPSWKPLGRVPLGLHPCRVKVEAQTTFSLYPTFLSLLVCFLPTEFSRRQWESLSVHHLPWIPREVWSGCLKTFYLLFSNAASWFLQCRQHSRKWDDGYWPLSSALGRSPNPLSEVPFHNLYNYMQGW